MKKRFDKKLKTVSLGSEIDEYMVNLKESSVESNNKRLARGLKKGSLNLMACWRSVASERIFNHTTNVVYKKRSEGTELLIYVDSAIYSTELTMEKEIHRIKMEKVLGKEIKDITFLVSRESSFRKRKV